MTMHHLLLIKTDLSTAAPIVAKLPNAHYSLVDEFTCGPAAPSSLRLPGPSWPKQATSWSST